MLQSVLALYVLDPEHQPIKLEGSLRDCLERWGKWMAVESNARVGLTQINEKEVSTVFLGRNATWSHKTSTEPPLLFETMIFAQGDKTELQVRYQTWEEAERGHNAIVYCLTMALIEEIIQNIEEIIQNLRKF